MPNTPKSPGALPPARGHGNSNRITPRPTTLRIRVVCVLIGGTGLILLIAGSFMPWVISGSVRRSSYAIVGLLGRLGIGDDGPIGVLVGGWPLVGVLCMTPVIAAALRWWWISGVLAVLLSLAAAALSFGVIGVAGGRAPGGIRIDPIGPSVMAAGAVLLFCGGFALALGAGSPVRRGAGQPSANKQQWLPGGVRPKE